MTDRDIILVGNGTSVMDQKLGATIDTFRTVVRFNNFVIEGFEEHVGTRTDICVRHPWVRATRDATIQYVRVVNGATNLPAHFLRPCDLLLPNDGQCMLEALYEPQIHLKYSTGMATLAHFVLHHPIVYILGYGHSPRYCNGFHYYADVSMPSVKHDYALERRIIEDLKRDGRCKEM